MKDYWVIMRELREDRDLKQAAVASALGISQQVYSRYETGINEMPIHHLIKLCQYYCVSSDYILGLSPIQTIITNGPDPRDRPYGKKNKNE